MLLCPRTILKKITQKLEVVSSAGASGSAWWWGLRGRDERGGRGGRVAAHVDYGLGAIYPSRGVNSDVNLASESLSVS
jgi:hypothetical protein